MVATASIFTPSLPLSLSITTLCLLSSSVLAGSAPSHLGASSSGVVWGQAGYSPAKDGQSPFSAPSSEQPMAAWNNTAGTTYTQSLEPLLSSYDGGRIIRVVLDEVTTTPAKLIVQHAATGDTVWSKQLGPTSSQHSTPALDSTKDRVIYFNNALGNIECASLDTGNLVWTKTTAASQAGSITIADNVVYVFMDQLYALNANDGTQLWRTTSLDRTYVAPAIHPDYVFVTSTSGLQGSLVAIKRSDGSIAWTYNDPTLGAISANAVVHGDKVLFAAHTTGAANAPAMLHAVEVSNGAALLWSHALSGPAVGAPAVSCDGIVVQSVGSEGSIKSNVAARTIDGDVAWDVTTPSSLISSPVIDADGTVFLLDLEGVVYSIVDKAIKYQFQVPAPCSKRTSCVAAPRVVLGQDSLYVDQYGTIFAYTADGKAPAIKGTGPWEACANNKPGGSSKVAVILWVTAAFVGVIVLGVWYGYKHFYVPRYGSVGGSSGPGLATSAEYNAFGDGSGGGGTTPLAKSSV